MSTPETTPGAPTTLSALFDEDVTRDRLLLAMAESLMEKGFAGTVVADIVKRARVSRRTFYEEFADRGECFLALGERTTEVERRVIEAAADPALPWEEQATHAIDSYFALMAAEPRLTHALLFEIYALGERGVAAHRQIHNLFTEQLVSLAKRSRDNGAEIREINYATSAAVVGAIYQLLQMLYEDEPRITVDEARQAAIDLVLDSARPRA
ncbi:MAG: TetR/AcrR family transcriptional regulator [Solirubrobacterales bacterium]